MDESSQKIINQGSKQKLWNKNFLLLLQGQMVSSFGDIVYQMALGFWVFQVTKSTALMGIIMAVAMIPKIVLGIIAGVFVDRWDRKKIIVFMDLIRGVAVTAVAIIILSGYESVWSIMVVGIILGACSAFFDPCMSSVMPDIVPKEKIVNANSIYSTGLFIIGLTGTAVGGVLYKVFTAPILFLINGLSYLLSSFTEMFIKLPKTEQSQDTEFSFKEDFKKGLKFIWDVKGILYLVSLIIGINFFFKVGSVLLIPLFERVMGFGADKYGYTMTLFLAGSLTGSLLLSIINLQPQKRFKLYYICGIVGTLSAIGVPVFGSFYLNLLFMFTSGLCMTMLNTILSAVTQIIVPQEMRGKVFSIIGTFTASFSPLGMVVGGVLGEVLGISRTMIIAFSCALILMLGIGLLKATKRMLSFDSTTQKLEDIID